MIKSNDVVTAVVIQQLFLRFPSDCQLFVRSCPLTGDILHLRVLFTKAAAALLVVRKSYFPRRLK